MIPGSAVCNPGVMSVIGWAPCEMTTSDIEDAPSCMHYQARLLQWSDAPCAPQMFPVPALHAHNLTRTHSSTTASSWPVETTLHRQT